MSERDELGEELKEQKEVTGQDRKPEWVQKGASAADGDTTHARSAASATSPYKIRARCCSIDR